MIFNPDKEIPAQYCLKMTALQYENSANKSNLLYSYNLFLFYVINKHCYTNEINYVFFTTNAKGKFKLTSRTVDMSYVLKSRQILITEF